MDKGFNKPTEKIREKRGDDSGGGGSVMMGKTAIMEVEQEEEEQSELNCLQRYDLWNLTLSLTSLLYFNNN